MLHRRSGAPTRLSLQLFSDIFGPTSDGPVLWLVSIVAECVSMWKPASRKPKARDLYQYGTIRKALEQYCTLSPKSWISMVCDPKICISMVYYPKFWISMVYYPKFWTSKVLSKVLDQYGTLSKGLNQYGIGILVLSTGLYIQISFFCSEITKGLIVRTLT